MIVLPVAWAAYKFISNMVESANKEVELRLYECEGTATSFYGNSIYSRYRFQSECRECAGLGNETIVHKQSLGSGFVSVAAFFFIPAFFLLQLAVHHALALRQRAFQLLTMGIVAGGARDKRTMVLLALLASCLYFMCHASAGHVIAVAKADEELTRTRVCVPLGRDCTIFSLSVSGAVSNVSACYVSANYRGDSEYYGDDDADGA